jgi:hypothetical protein
MRERRPQERLDNVEINKMERPGTNASRVGIVGAQEPELVRTKELMGGDQKIRNLEEVDFLDLPDIMLLGLPT